MFERLICALFGHRLIVQKVLNKGARKVGCMRCDKCWGMHDATQTFVPWDEELDRMYAPGGPLDPEVYKG